MTSIDDRLTQIIRELIGNGITLDQAVQVFEGKFIVAAMDANRGNITKASAFSAFIATHFTTNFARRQC